MIELEGIAWNHTRGFTSVVAAAQRFEELNPDVTIRWSKRSLQAFADASMADLASRFDLIVMDHPHTALAATEGFLLPYEDWVSEGFLADQARHSVGASHASYRFGDRQWTLATDAATPIATWRPDLMQRDGLELPRSWKDVLDLAGAGRVSVSAFPVDCLMHTYTLCEALGGSPFSIPAELAPEGVIASALDMLRELVALCDPVCLERNPIRVAEWMSTVADDGRASYCPLAYGYSNYSRPGYAAYVLQAGGLVSFQGNRLRSTLGGAGLAVSARTRHPRECMDYAAFVAAPTTQRGIYFEAGGQPGHRSAWTDPVINARCSDFFSATLETHDEALLRPQHPGYMDFQNAGSPVAHAAVAGTMSVAQAAKELNRLYADASV